MTAAMAAHSAAAGLERRKGSRDGGGNRHGAAHQPQVKQQGRRGQAGAHYQQQPPSRLQAGQRHTHGEHDSRQDERAGHEHAEQRVDVTDGAAGEARDEVRAAPGKRRQNSAECGVHGQAPIPLS
jgi:hypothetical protein